MTYKMTHVHFELIPRFNISSTPGVLPIIYDVPVQSSKLPLPNSNAFTSFADCKIRQLKNSYKGNFVPYAYT